MTAHQIAKALLAGPDLPVVINGWGSDEGFTFEVTEISEPGTCAFSGARDTKDTPRDARGYQLPRECLSLYHGKSTPPSDAQLRAKRKADEKAAALKLSNPALYALTHAQFTPLTPEMLSKMAQKNPP